MYLHKMYASEIQFRWSKPNCLSKGNSCLCKKKRVIDVCDSENNFKFILHFAGSTIFERRDIFLKHQYPYLCP